MPKVTAVRGRWCATLENWKPAYTQILLLTSKGVCTKDIAEKLQVGTSQVALVQTSPYFIEKLTSLKAKTIERITDRWASSTDLDKAREILNKAAIAASRKVVRLAKKGSSQERLQFDACRDILDRAGLKPIERIETRERVYSPEEVMHARAILQETETIIERLETRSSPFVLGDKRQGKLESSDTDESSDDEHQEDSTGTG